MAIPQLNQYDDLRKEVAQRYEQLHPDLKAALVSVDTAGAVYEIAKKFGLNIEKTGYLADVIGYTIIGLLPVADFINNLKDTLGIDGAKAEEIAREVNNKIFLAIREQLKKTHGEKWDERGFHEQPRTATTNSREQPRTAPTPQTPTTPKSPWEIKPDEMAQETRDKRQETWGKSVIPPTPVLSIKDQVLRTETAKAAEAGLKQPTTPIEPPKTREAPQPAPMVEGVAILKEIKPSQPTTYNLQPTITPTKPETMPPAGLPIMKEAEKLMQTPELPKPSAPMQAETAKIPQTPTPKPVALEQIIPPQALQTPQTQTPTQQKLAQSSPAQTPKYNLDPYREPIE